ncbi:MAG: suppressor of fused domain protein [Chloroflexota bacterium]
MSLDDVPRSPGGSPMLRHAPVDRPFEPGVPGDLAEEVEEKLSAQFGPVGTVLHEIVSDRIHLDVMLVEPSAERDYWTLFTVGMSARPMSVPPGCEDLRYAELVLKLPSDWRLDLLQVTPPTADLERWYWPIRWLKVLARIPHDYDTWLAQGHTIPSADPPEPLGPDTRLVGWLTLPPLNPVAAREIALSDGTVLHPLVIHALYQDELNLKLKRGTDALLDAFGKAQLSEVLDPTRPSTVASRKRGLFSWR